MVDAEERVDRFIDVENPDLDEIITYPPCQIYAIMLEMLSAAHKLYHDGEHDKEKILVSCVHKIIGTVSEAIEAPKH